MMTASEILNPNKEIPATSRVWFVLALLSLIVALFIAFNAGWQHGEIHVPSGDGFKKVSDAVVVNLLPKMTTMLIAVLMYASFLVRRCVRGVSNIPTLLLVIGNVLLSSTFIEAILPAQEISIFSVCGVDVFKVSPQKLLVFVVLFSWISMRAIAGFGILFLIWAFIARMSSVNEALGLYGALYVLFSFVTFMLQMKLPYMMPEGGFLSVLKQDFGLITAEANKNVCATTDAVKKTVVATIKAVNAGVSATVPVAGSVSSAITEEITSGLLCDDKSER